MEEVKVENLEVEKEQAHTPPPEKKSSPSRNVILIVVGVLILLAVIILVTLAKSNVNKNTNKNIQPSTTLRKKGVGSILLSPSTVVGAPNQTSIIDVIVNTGGDPISGVIVGIQYNPLTVTKVALYPSKDSASPLSFALEQVGQVQYDATDGWAILTLKLPKNIVSLNGVGKVATLSFVTKPINVAISSTNITLSEISAFLYPNKGESAEITKNQLIINYNK